MFIYKKLKTAQVASDYHQLSSLVKIIMLTSSYADFRNEIESAGINQVKHQIILEVRVQIDVMLPWEVKSTEVVSEVLIAETVLVGKVPDTYLNLNQP